MENTIFDTVQNKTEFKKWIIRHYFSNNQNINEENVLEYISTAKDFNSTPSILVGLWKIKGGFKSSDNKIKKTEKVEKVAKYCVGDETLQTISKEVGNVTMTMVTKIHANAVNKIKFITKNQSLETLEEQDIDEINAKIMFARKEAIAEYINILMPNKNMIKNILEELVKRKFLTKNEVNLITENEFLELIKLSNKTPEEIEAILSFDIETDNNIFKTFQSIVSKKFFKNKRFV